MGNKLVQLVFAHIYSTWDTH